MTYRENTQAFKMNTDVTSVKHVIEHIVFCSWQQRFIPFIEKLFNIAGI
jgi:hypothetical protein